MLNTLQDLNPGIQAHIICDSLIDGVRVTTYELRFPRFILPELNTHRVFSRNSASSRARSIKRSFTEVMEDPFVPQPFTKNKKGMSGAQLEGAHQQACKEAWLRSRDCAMVAALDLLVGQEKRRSLMGEDIAHYQAVIDAYDMETDEPSVHKQHVNRLLEPFMWHTTVLSSTEWDNFFELRIAPDAQPEIHELAVKMHEAYKKSAPQETSYHLPYYDQAKEDSDKPSAFAIKRSVACCASVSYKAPSELGDGAVERIFEQMAKHKHLSPFEHLALSSSRLEEFCQSLGWELEGGIPTAQDTKNSDWSGNFRPGLIQLRKVLEKRSQA